jgi:hypothetical protein
MVKFNSLFVISGGFVLIQCDTPAGFEKRTLQLVMDYLTDTITAKTTVPGTPHVTPDAKYIVNVDTDIGAIAVQKMSEDGKFVWGLDDRNIYDVMRLIHVRY